ncbi:MAG: thermonuclease family protein [Mollicutes bacterium]|nr:thermonuclease family protein [Mollicutes bacterium]
MKKVLLLLFCFAINVYATPKTEEATFEACVDGDTAYFKVAEDTLKVRFIAIDAPELKDDYGKEASEFTCDTLLNAKEILLEYDADKADKYGRVLAWVWYDKKLLQKTLIEKGFAQTAYIYKDYRYVNSLCFDEKKAKENKVGVWSKESTKYKYCDEKSISDLDYNINYDDILEEKKDNKLSKTDEKRLKKIIDTSQKASEFLQKNDKKISEYGTYIILLIASIFVFFGKKKQ